MNLVTLALTATVEKGGSWKGQRTYQTQSGEGSTTFRAVSYREVGGYHPVGTSYSH